MIKHIFIGVDGGGTKSTIRIEDEARHLLGQTTGGPANIRLSVNDAWQSIYQAIETILSPLDMTLQDKDYRFHAGMGLAGCESTHAHQSFLNHTHPFTTLELTSDAHIACSGAHDNQDGAIIAIGTGIIGYQIQNGKNTRVSGWGFPHSDEGSGAWLGLEAIRLTLHWLDHRLSASPLLEDIFAFFAHDKKQLVNWANQANSAEFAQLAPLVIKHSQQQEPVALALIKQAAAAVDQMAFALAKQQAQPLAYCLYGSLAPFVEPWLDSSWKNNIIPCKADASTGAIYLMREKIL